MVTQKQLYRLVSIFRGFANKYGAINLDTGVDWTNLSPALKKLSPEDIYFTLAENSGNAYIFKNGYIYSPLYQEKKHKNIFMSYIEFPQPSLLQAKDVASFEVVSNLPVSPELAAFKTYLGEKSSKEPTDVARFIFFFSFWVNSTPPSESDAIVAAIEQYFAIDRDEQFLSLFHAALDVQPSWFYAGLQKKDRKKNCWFDPFLANGTITIVQIDRVHQFALAASALYGFLSYADAYPLYKKYERAKALPLDLFSLTLKNFHHPLLSNVIADVIVSSKLQRDDEVALLSHQQKKEITEYLKQITDSIVSLSLYPYYLLHDERACLSYDFKVLRKNQFYHYAQQSFLAPNAVVDELFSLLPHFNSESDGRVIFNEMLNSNFNLLSSDCIVSYYLRKSMHLNQEDELIDETENMAEEEKNHSVESFFQVFYDQLCFDYIENTGDRARAEELISEILITTPSWFYKGYTATEAIALAVENLHE